MKLRNKILGISATTALATIALVSCRGKDKTYTIELDGNATGVTLDTTELSVKNTEALLAELNNIKPTRTGYTFVKWTADAAGKVEITASTKLADLKGDNGYTVYAQFKKNEYTVTLNLKGNATGTAGKIVTEAGEVTSIGASYGDTIELIDPTVNATTKNGGEMSFKGWFTDEACTTLFDTTTAIKSNTTLYAGWQIVTISTVDEFIAFAEKNSTMNAEITADLDFTGKPIVRTSANTELVQKEDGSESTNALKHVLSGNGHTLSNITINSNMKSGSIWASLKDGSIKNLAFENVTYTGTKENVGLIAGNAEGKCVLEDIVVDGYTGTINKNAALLIGQVKNSSDISIEGVVIKDASFEGVDGGYVGGLIGIVAANASGTLDIKDILIDDFSITEGTSKKPQRGGMIIGTIKEVQNGTSLIDITIDGVVARGNFGNIKASAALVSTDADAKLDIKNVYIDGYNSVQTQDNNSSVLVSMNKSATAANVTLTNCNYRGYGVSLVGKDGPIAADQGTNVTAAQAATLTISSNIVYADGAFKMNVNGEDYTLAITADPAVEDVSDKAATIDDGDLNYQYDNTDIETKFGTLGANDYAITGIFAYYEKVVAGKAGYGFKVTITPNAEITLSEGRNIVSTDASKATILADGSIEAYFIMDQAEKDEFEFKAGDPTKQKNNKITIQWYFNGEHYATPIEYNFVMSNKAGSYGTRVAPGAIACSTATAQGINATVDTTDNTKLNVTGGEIAYNTTADANIVTAEITAPTGIGEVTADSITVVGATKGEFAAGVLTVNVPISTKGDNKFTIAWNSARDADSYNVNVAQAVTLAENPSGESTKSISFDAETALASVDQDASIDAGTYYGSFVTSGSTKRAKSSKFSIEVSKNLASSLNFTVSSGYTATVTLVLGSTGSDKTSDHCGLFTSDNAAVTEKNGVVDVTGIVETTLTYENVVAGTYKIGTTGTSRGVRIYRVTVVMTKVSA